MFRLGTRGAPRMPRSRLSIRRDRDFFLVPAEWMSTAFGDGSRGSSTNVHVRSRACTAHVREPVAWSTPRDSKRNARVCTDLRASASLHVRVDATARKSVHVRIARTRVCASLGYVSCLCVRQSGIAGRRPPSQWIEALISLTTLSSGLLGVTRNCTRR